MHSSYSSPIPQPIKPSSPIPPLLLRLALLAVAVPASPSCGFSATSAGPPSLPGNAGLPRTDAGLPRTDAEPRLCNATPATSPGLANDGGLLHQEILIPRGDMTWAILISLAPLARSLAAIADAGGILLAVLNSASVNVVAMAGSNWPGWM